MTDEKICPIMSRPSQGNMTKLYSSEPLYESEEEMKKYGWTPINGKPYSDVVPCLRERCTAWVPQQTIEYRCTIDIKNSEMCPLERLVEIPYNQAVFCARCPHYKSFEIERIPAHCKMIERR